VGVTAGNIWAHLGPAVVVAIVMGRRLIRDEQHLAVHWSVLLPEFCCLMLSTTYHTFMAQITHYHAWLKADVRIPSLVCA
jgi:predicted membrane channel-forming protein YqfA (hemolysin III family)